MYFFSFLKGLAIGAGTSYFLDPVAGARRRSHLRDRMTAKIHKLQCFVDRGSRDLANRCQGMMSGMKGMCSHAEASSQKVAERVRSTMGRYVSHPRAIHVEVEDGRIVLSGAILAAEVGPFLSAISRVPGVEEISNHLDIHEKPDILSLQGQGRHRDQQSDPLHVTRTPGVQLLAVGLGTALVASCIIRQRPAAFLAGCVACGLFTRAISDPTTFSQHNRDVAHTGSQSSEQQTYVG